jgi:hypothetical protein
MSTLPIIRHSLRCKQSGLNREPSLYCDGVLYYGTIVQMDKRPTVNEDLYYEMLKAAADRKLSVKSWLEEAIREKLERQKAEEAESPKAN